ncbi:hypothetical protein Y590_22413 [Methylobacterium sp. AMS5]|nr:hypothetical protein Y590_22413 [Methylobacterium sp. AMS5]
MDTDHLRAIAEVAPSLKRAAEEEYSHWHPELPPRTILASSLGMALITNPLDQESLRRVFEICELALAENHPDRDAVGSGFLEILQHADDNRDFDFETVVEFLGPRSLAHCRAMDKFYGTHARGL